MKRVPLRYLCAPSLRPVNSDSGMPYVGLECVEPRSGSLRNHDLPRHESQHALLAPSGSVIFGKLRPYLGKSLRVARPLAVSPEFLVLIPAQAMDARFLAYLARSYDFMSAAVESVEGVKMPRTSWSLLRDFAAWSPERSARRR